MTEEDSLCRAIYAETNDLFAKVKDDLRSVRGFRILYGPPFVGAPYLFLGYQPGGRSETPEVWHGRGYHDGWPKVSDYVAESWPLARRLRDIFGVDVLSRCAGLNAIFFQCPTVREWKKNDRSLIAELEAFSVNRTQQIVSALAPERIIVIGFGTFNLLGASEDIALQVDKRVLIRRGSLWGFPAFGIIHLSGARISREHVEAIRTFFANEISN